MKKSTAREIAVGLSFFAGNASMTVPEAAELFFDEEYYATLSAENELYAEYPEKKQMDYIIRLASLTGEHRAQLDGYIEKYSQGWRVERLSRTAAMILRCAMCEILYMEDVPNKVAINEAVELAKGYDDEKTVAFINGVLGSFVRGELQGEIGE